MTGMTQRLVLGSSSPYRRALLERLGVPFEVEVPAIDESMLEGEHPRATAQRLAATKARAVAASVGNGVVVIGSDQVAASGSLRLEKPGDARTAVKQLLSIRGLTLQFFTAVHVVDSSSGRTLGLHCDETRVVIRSDLTEQMLHRYVALDRPLDCAGSARVESLGIALLERCDSTDPTALVGLPMIVLSRILREAGVDPLMSWPS
jgi:septum formation protein